MSNRPIFIIGRNRSGTKWLSNLMSNHSQLASLQREGAGGIIEVNELWNVPRVFGDPKIPENRLAFFAFFERTNTFYLSGLTAESVRKISFSDYQEFFRAFMDLITARSGKNRWLQKSHTLVLPELVKSFPDAYFIIINRENIIDNVRSSIALQWIDVGNRSRKRLFAEVMSYVQHIKFKRRYLKNERVLSTTYEELRKAPEQVVRQVCDFTGLPYEGGMLTQAYKPNSSFSGNIKREEVLSGLDCFKVSIYYAFCMLLPHCLYALAAGRFVNAIRNKTGVRLFQRHTFSIGSKVLADEQKTEIN